MGFSSMAMILGVHPAVGWAERGVAPALVQFVRTLGGLIWVSVMGATMNLDPELWVRLPVEHLALMRESLAEAPKAENTGD